MKAGATADRNGFFYVLDRTNGAFLSATPFVSNINWAKGIDEKRAPIYDDATAPATRPSPRRQEGQVRLRDAGLPRRQELEPDRLQPRHPAVLRPLQRVGHGHLERAGELQKGAAYLGAGFTIKPTFEDHIGSLKAIDPATKKVVWEYKNKAPLGPACSPPRATSSSPERPRAS